MNRTWKASAVSANTAKSAWAAARGRTVTPKTTSQKNRTATTRRYGCGDKARGIGLRVSLGAAASKLDARTQGKCRCGCQRDSSRSLCTRTGQGLGDAKLTKSVPLT